MIYKILNLSLLTGIVYFLHEVDPNLAIVALLYVANDIVSQFYQAEQKRKYIEEALSQLTDSDDSSD